MPDPIATIVITTRNRGELAHRAVASALAQTISNIEVIVVDDASDEPFGWDDEDPRVHIIRRESCEGVCAARNAGVDAARGDWMIFLDDDDELLPQMVELSMHAAANSILTMPVAVISGMEIVDSEGRMLVTRLPVSVEKGRHYFLEAIPGKKSFTVCNTLFVPRYVLEQIGGWDQSTSPTEHSDLMLRLNQACSIEGVREVTYRKTNHPGVQWHENLLARARGMEQVLAKHPSVFALHRKKKAHFLATIGINYLKAGKWGRAIVNTSRALLLSPRHPKAYVWWMASLGGPLALKCYRKLREAVPSSAS